MKRAGAAAAEQSGGRSRPRCQASRHKWTLPPRLRPPLLLWTAPG